MSDDDRKLLEAITVALKKIDKKSSAIRFDLSGQHDSENRIIGTLDGYKTLGLKIAQAALKYQDEPKQCLDLVLSDVTVINRETNAAKAGYDIGFDTFVVSVNCELDTMKLDELIEKRDSPGPFWVAMLIVCIPAYILYEGVVAIFHKLF